jgi:hypothetical protein
MKTNYQTLSSEAVNSLKSLISNTEKRTIELDYVLKEIRKDLKKTETDLANTIDKNWKRFKQLHAENMPHIKYNGKAEVVICDWVEKPQNYNENKAISEYRYTCDDKTTKCDVCIDGTIVREKEVAVKFQITHPSGYSEEVTCKDADGKPIRKIEKMTLVPKAKSAWGFTETMVLAFIAAADDLLSELAAAKETEQEQA